MVSIFEPHTRIIRRGKSGKATEFGRKVWLCEVEGGIISDYRILEGNPEDESRVVPSLETHRRLFGRAPELLAGDRGTHSAANEAAAREQGVKRVALPKPGAKSEERQHYEQQGWFRRARRFRAGISRTYAKWKRQELAPTLVGGLSLFTSALEGGASRKPLCRALHNVLLQLAFPTSWRFACRPGAIATSCGVAKSCGIFLEGGRQLELPHIRSKCNASLSFASPPRWAKRWRSR